MEIFNTLTRKKEKFQPIKPGIVNMYLCGSTVYDYCHIGHARTIMVTFDIVTRYLRARGFKVNYVRNITDIDDKIIQRANDLKITPNELTQKFIDAMHEDEAALNVLKPDHEPRATEFVPQMIALIEKLMANGYAYKANNGDICFHVAKFQEYGKLAHKDLEGLRAGARVEISDAKQDPLDFVLWKLAKEGEPSWPSPFGAGRPGWHSECVAMSMQLLGESFDIHGGGFDLQFPHHENEIAQAESCTHKKFVNTWMHVGFIQINKEKMSKSLGNFFTIREVLAKFPAEIVRYFLISSHYRSPINFSDESLENAKAALTRLYSALRGIDIPNLTLNNIDHHYRHQFYQAMDDDFNTPIALAVLFDCVHELNRIREKDIERAKILAGTIKTLGGILGMLENSPEKFLHQEISQDEKTKIENLIQARIDARAQKNWQEADRIRAELTAMNIIVEDAAGKTIWKKG